MNLTFVVAANITGWPLSQLSIAWVVTKMSSCHFARDYWFYRVANCETKFYRRWFRVRRWKRKLPDGARWVGGHFRKKRLEGVDAASLRRLVIETRRGEFAHWLMLGCLPIFFTWNPRWAWTVMAGYALAANVPCIVVQRYNREVAGRLLSRHDMNPTGRISPLCLR